MSSPDLDRAAEFIELNARLIDRRRFALHFGDGDAGALVEALRPYRNADGGFGNALEPDLRDPASQPHALVLAFETLTEAGAFDDPIVAAGCDWLETVTAADGGVPFVLDSAVDHPRAPWWQPDPEHRGSTTTTSLLAALLHSHGVDHPWLDRATEFSWRGIAELDFSSAYEARGAFAFLDHVPDRERAEAAMADVGPRLIESGLVALDPDTAGEAHFPLDFAPEPGRLSRAPFDDDLIERHLEALAAGQRDDGGWTFNFLAWAPLVELEWRGFFTVLNLRILRANGRL